MTTLIQIFTRAIHALRNVSVAKETLATPCLNKGERNRGPSLFMQAIFPLFVLCKKHAEQRVSYLSLLQLAQKPLLRNPVLLRAQVACVLRQQGYEVVPSRHNQQDLLVRRDNCGALIRCFADGKAFIEQQGKTNGEAILQTLSEDSQKLGADAAVVISLCRLEGVTKDDFKALNVFGINGYDVYKLLECATASWLDRQKAA